MKNPLDKSVYLERTSKRDVDVRGEYFRDQTAIIHSMPFRRLKHKTQVFFSPDNDHICTRIEHVLHVATIAATICKGLISYGWELDIEMAYAIGLGHDLGHAPFGHAGEEVLAKKLGDEKAFMHELNSYRVVEHLANDGKGLDLTYGVKDGIICHNGEKSELILKPASVKNDLENIKDRNCMPSSYEGCIVRFSDKIAYLGRDIEDAILAKLVSIRDVPQKVANELGNTNGQIINSLVIDMIENSHNKDSICFSDEKYEVFDALRNFNYKYIYKNEKMEEYKVYCYKIVLEIFEYLEELYKNLGNDYGAYKTRDKKLDKAFGSFIESMDDFYPDEKNKPAQIVTDYVSGMTDSFALDCMKQITIPSPIDFF
jgi:dGTPase